MSRRVKFRVDMRGVSDPSSWLSDRSIVLFGDGRLPLDGAGGGLITLFGRGCFVRARVFPLLLPGLF